MATSESAGSTLTVPAPAAFKRQNPGVSREIYATVRKADRSPAVQAMLRIPAREFTRRAGVVRTGV